MSHERHGAASGPRVTSVWVVEDNVLYLRTTAQLIAEQDDMDCPVAVTTCEEALAALEEGAVPDIVLMDVGLPGLDGVEGARRMGRLSPATRIVMLTVHDERDTIFQAIEAGASGYLLKSSTSERLLQAIRQVRDGGAPLNASIARKILDRFGTDDAARGEYGLTEREIQVLELMVGGLTLHGIADRLTISPHTVDTHIRNIYAKLHVRSRGSAVAKAVKERLI